jgi:1-pyrroline-5-carboxylate dehydrogenase
MAEGFRITYATMSADNEELHAAYDQAIAEAKGSLGATIPVVVNGEERSTAPTYELRSPIDNDLVLGHISMASADDVNEAVAAAKGFATEWDRMGWQTHVELIRRVADIISERRSLLAALMALEVGKNRLEALGDVEETADLMRWNAKEIEDHDGFRVPMQSMGAQGEYYDVMRPYGVWAVISPFNFPMALAGGPSSGALVAGNTVVFKPANQGALLGWYLYECYRDAGMPAAEFQYLPGRG